ncbi:MAG TPA: hypothetical protein VGM79_24005 [Streptosporangiaceae bacterium]|jgi:hypothetical protein
MIHHAVRLGAGLVLAAGKGVAIGVHHLAGVKAAHAAAASAHAAAGTTAAAGFHSAFTMAQLGQIHAAAITQPSLAHLLHEALTTKITDGSVGAVVLGLLVKGYLEEAGKEHEGVRVEVNVNEAGALLEMARQAAREYLEEQGVPAADARVVRLDAEAQLRRKRLKTQFNGGPGTAAALIA